MARCKQALEEQGVSAADPVVAVPPRDALRYAARSVGAHHLVQRLQEVLGMPSPTEALEITPGVCCLLITEGHLTDESLGLPTSPNSRQINYPGLISTFGTTLY